MFCVPESICLALKYISTVGFGGYSCTTADLGFTVNLGNANDEWKPLNVISFLAHPVIGYRSLPVGSY